MAKREPPVEPTVDPTPPRRPRIDVLERRLQNPFGEPACEIQMRDANVQPRWFNDDVKAGQIHRAKELGWLPVEPSMVFDLDAVGFHTITAGQITRGPRGQEVLMWMPADAYKQIQWAKTRKNLELMRDMDRTKQDLVAAVASEYGGQAGDYANQHVGPVGSVRDNFERIQKIPEGE